MLETYFNFFGLLTHNPIQLISYSVVLFVMTVIAFYSVRSRAMYIFPVIFLVFGLSILGWVFYSKEESWEIPLVMSVAFLAISFLLFYISSWIYSRYR